MTSTVMQGDCLALMRDFRENTFDSIVTDPPYALTTTKRWKDATKFAQNQSDVGKRFSKGFMGKEWDGKLPDVAHWEEALRICKPGAHMLAFGGTRTHHRLMVAIEDAGWEIRDTLMWVYGSGFPKSLDVSKAIDKMAGVEREVIGEYSHPDGKPRNWKDHKNASSSLYEMGMPKDENSRDITAPATDAAKQWDGWGTALKPAWEPIILCRKPLNCTVAENVQKWRTGGINIDGCRVGTDIVGWGGAGGFTNLKDTKTTLVKGGEPRPTIGRFPANLIHDGSDEVLALFPETKSGCSNGNAEINIPSKDGNIPLRRGTLVSRTDNGSAARFFYCAKASKSERNLGLPEGVRNTHPTVKPLSLMQYLCKLITPPNGIILDPFCGSGSTGIAATKEGFTSIRMELDVASYTIAATRTATLCNNTIIIPAGEEHD